ncbi:hypothetical protein M758_UG172300 [Ceratodon purpureus]|nr:hypothetical protein M758_UG172300 [Ceratodon purpureus]
MRLALWRSLFRVLGLSRCEDATGRGCVRRGGGGGGGGRGAGSAVVSDFVDCEECNWSLLRLL